MRRGATGGVRGSAGAGRRGGRPEGPELPELPEMSEISAESRRYRRVSERSVSKLAHTYISWALWHGGAIASCCSVGRRDRRWRSRRAGGQAVMVGEAGRRAGAGRGATTRASSWDADDERRGACGREHAPAMAAERAARVRTLRGLRAPCWREHRRIVVTAATRFSLGVAGAQAERGERARGREVRGVLRARHERPLACATARTEFEPRPRRGGEARRDDLKRLCSQVYVY